MVDVSVHKIDNATSALHKKAIRFDAVPPGQLPRTIMPRANSGGILKILIKKYAARGITVNWRQTAIKIKYGLSKTFFTWLKFKVIPIPNITSPNKKGMESLKISK